TTEATWRKDAIGNPLRLLDGEGRPISLTVGQTFVQVVERGTRVTVVPGKPVPDPTADATGPG
ncbi:MAG TPA: hypothetical protein VM344_09500, partial [Vitreimonas sp.]|nr:hypothetical protein [Vitreimonas sp.]